MIYLDDALCFLLSVMNDNVVEYDPSFFDTIACVKQGNGITSWQKKNNYSMPRADPAQNTWQRRRFGGHLNAERLHASVRAWRCNIRHVTFFWIMLH